MPRDRLLGFVYLLLSLNAMPTFVGEAVQTYGWGLAALNLFDISAIVWLAMAAGWAISFRQSDTSPPGRMDLVLALAAVGVAIVPVPPVSAAALSAAALWGVISSPSGSSGRRAAAVYLSLSTFFFWGRIFLALGAGPLLSADAWFVSQISGMPAAGNVVSFADGERFMIAPGCSSLHGMSLALILWTTAIAWFRLRLSRRLVWTLVISAVASVLVNGARLTMIAWYPQDFDYWHVGTGAVLFGWVSLLFVLGVTYRGLAKEIR